VERLEHVLGRIAAGITSEKIDFGRFLAFLSTVVWPVGHLIIPLDRAHRVVLGSRLERLEHVPRRIAAGITIIGPTFL
jgi:hypothetical protein